MSEQSEQTFETQFLNKHPSLREVVIEDENFRSWRDKLATVIVDDVKYYIRGGDMLRDEEQIIFEWAHRAGLIPGELF